MTTENAIAKTEAKAAFVARFISVLGDPATWKHEDEVNDLGAPNGRCICGHPIRYEYVLVRGAERQCVGSECINHFREYNIDLYNQLAASHARLREQAKEEKRRQKEILEQAEVAALREEFTAQHTAIRDAVAKMRANRTWVDYPLYCTAYKIGTKPSSTLKTVRGALNWYKKNLAIVKDTRARYNV